jgi:hypothetical protein
VSDQRSLPVLVFCIIASLSMIGCGLCGCDDSDADAATLLLATTALGAPVDQAQLSVNWHLLSDDEFTLTTNVRNQPPTTASGTFKKDGDTVTFTFANGTSAFFLGGKYTLVCSKQDGREVIVLKRQGLAGAEFTFVCHS